MTGSQPLGPTHVGDDRRRHVGADAAVTSLPLHQLMGRHLRLARELGAVCTAHPLDIGRINRLSGDVADTASQIAARSGAVRSVPAGEPLAA